jgi:hypothetical protein
MGWISKKYYDEAMFELVAKVACLLARDGKFKISWICFSSLDWTSIYRYPRCFYGCLAVRLKDWIRYGRCFE